MGINMDEKLLQRPNYVEKVCGTILNIILIIIAGVLVFSFITVLSYNLDIVNGGSMTNTLQSGQFVLCSKNPKIEDIERGDIITFQKDLLYIKRVVAIGGDTIEFRKDGDAVTLYIQKGSEGEFEPLEEDYIKEPMKEEYFNNHRSEIGVELDKPITVREGCLFALGDNRNDSTDSRFAKVGQVEASEIKGKVIDKIEVGSFEEAFYGLIYGAYFKAPQEQ